MLLVNYLYAWGIWDWDCSHLPRPFQSQCLDPATPVITFPGLKVGKEHGLPCKNLSPFKYHPMRAGGVEQTVTPWEWNGMELTVIPWEWNGMEQSYPMRTGGSEWNSHPWEWYGTEWNSHPMRVEHLQIVYPGPSINIRLKETFPTAFTQHRVLQIMHHYIKAIMHAYVRAVSMSVYPLDSRLSRMSWHCMKYL